MSHKLPEGFIKDVVGYCDPLSVRPGQDVHFKISSHRPGPAKVEMVRLISGDDRPHGTGLIEEPVACDLPTAIDLAFQPLVPGSYGYVPDMPEIAGGSLSCWVFPTLLSAARQTVLSCAGVSISVSDNGFYLRWPDGDLMLDLPVRTHRWHRLTVDLSGPLSLAVQRAAVGVGEQGLRRVATADEAAVEIPAGDWYFAAQTPGIGHFNGRLEAPRIAAGDATVAHWDFSRDIASQRLVDVAEHGHHGTLAQTPTRAVRGVRWDGSAQSFEQAPGHYAAIHFHEDDLTDAGWTDSIVWQAPRELASGQYALKVSQGESEDYIPFFVRPARGKRGADLVYLVPTASYLAYANQRLAFTGGIFGSSTFRHANAAYLYAHPEVGDSLYEYHRDGSGVHFSSRLRPILNMKPRNTTWAFNADTHITAWLHAIGQRFDVVTDEDLHREGADALGGYRTVITGTHPEYYSTAMRDGLSRWLGEGGRLMYMGGNGFYWRIAYQPDNPAIIEVRRAEDGTRAWIAEPGEYYHQFNGEYGGLWRRLGGPPNELVGVGFAAQGFDGGTYYRVAPDTLDPRVGFAVQGLSGSEIWGNFGNQGGGAAGEEIDRLDLALGSPPHALVLARSENHRPGMLRVKEEFHMMEPLGEDPDVRADMVFFETPSGGAVFSTGSISYAGSLAHNGYENDIATLTANVLRRFLDPQAFVFPESRE